MVIKFLKYLARIVNIILFLIYLFVIITEKTYNYNIIIIFSILIFNTVISFDLYLKL